MLPGYAFPWDGAVLVGLSGGPDSRLLLHLLATEREHTGRPVYAAHLNHGMRGSEADRDEAFCIRLAQEYGIELFVDHVNVPALCAASGNSPELEARLCRYRFFERIMSEHHIPLLATAHNADDQLETILLRLLRGTGTKGLCGIPKERPLPGGGLVVRPLLDCTRADILQACEREGLTYVTDSTNLQDDCTRNRIRHHVVPALSEIVGEGIAQRAAVRLAESMQEDEQVLKALSENVSDSLSDLQAAPPALAKRAIRRLYATYGASVGVSLDSGPYSLSAAHLNDLLALCRTGRPHSRLTLPCGVQAVIEDGRLHFEANTQAPPPCIPDHPVPLCEGINQWDSGRITVELTVTDCPTHPAGADVYACAVFPLTDETKALYARTRREGDIIQSHGMTKKLKKLICDKKIPLALRDRLPLICMDADGQEPLWFPGVAFRDGFPCPTQGTAVCITVRITDT